MYLLYLIAVVTCSQTISSPTYRTVEYIGNSEYSNTARIDCEIGYCLTSLNQTTTDVTCMFNTLDATIGEWTSVSDCSREL